MLRLSWAVYETTTQLSMPLRIPTSNKLKFLCLHLPSNWCPQFWDLGHSDRCIVVFYCYNFPFPNNKKNHSEHLFMYVLSVICVSSLVRSLGHFSIGFLGFYHWTLCNLYISCASTLSGLCFDGMLPSRCLVFSFS